MDLTRVPEQRIEPLKQLIEQLTTAENIALITHVNADGDGAGSEAAVASWLHDRGKRVHITNPTPFPEAYKYTVEDWMILDHTHAATANYLATTDLVFVLDTGEPKRIGRHADAAVKRPLIVLDHHPLAESPFRPLAQLLDTTACATGELVYDLLSLAGYDRWELRVCEAIYTAIITDTGSFRFSNTTPRAHALAGEMIRCGVDPELMYRRLYGTVPMRRMALIRAALDNLEVDGALPLTWITISRDIMVEADASAEDLEGLIDYARSIEGTEIAILFRETNDGSTKISFRSTGQADVNALARQFGGGGHIKAAGALVSDKLEVARKRVLEATRIALRDTLK